MGLAYIGDDSAKDDPGKELPCNVPEIGMEGGLEISHTTCHCEVSADTVKKSCFVYQPVTIKNTSECCGEMLRVQIHWIGLLIYEYFKYTPTSNEKNNYCKREPPVAFYQAQAKLPMTGGCQCLSFVKNCFLTTTTATTPTTTTTTPTTPTTTTTTTPTTTTTTASQPLCPVPPPLDSTTTAKPVSVARVLGGITMNPCSASGVLSFNSNNDTTCNGVIAYNPQTKSNKVYMTDFCNGVLGFLKTALNVLNSADFNQAEFNPAGMTYTASANDISYFNPPRNLSSAKCRTVACLYNAATMKDAIDFNTCYLTSFGIDVKGSRGTFAYSGSLNKVMINKSTACKTKPASVNGQCFIATDSKVRGCWGDSGAPVYCKLKTTKETVLYGMLDVTGSPPTSVSDTGNDKKLCADNNEFHVLSMS